MSRNLIISSLEGISPYQQNIEIVERKGLGHPDTICDHAAEQVSVALSSYYLEEFGAIMHHNVDKALLIGGTSRPRYKGGDVIEPMELIIAGRAVKSKNEKFLPVEEISSDAIKEYLTDKLRLINIEKNIKITIHIRPGSQDLTELFQRFAKGTPPLSNDTSCGTGYYPTDELEKTVYRTENFLNSRDLKQNYPFIGEDIKVMGLRHEKKIHLTVSIAMIDRYLSGLDDYIEKINVTHQLLRKEPWFRGNYFIDINTADSYENGSVYLTVTGTSAEMGDDGEVGRGNRANGLITPFRTMSLEAVAGKNPISHVGKLYNLFAMDLSREIVEKKFAEEAYVNIVSQIGKPINEPLVLDIKLKDQTVAASVISEFALDMLDNLPQLWRKIIKGQYEIA